MSNLLEQASLVMIPSGYAEDIVYSEIPLDGSGDLQLTRASNGTRVNSAGLVEVCPWNLIPNSQTFASWSKVQISGNTVTVTDNFTTAPNGTLTAAKVVFGTFDSTAQIYQDYTLSPTQVLNATLYAKVPSGTKQVNFGFFDGALKQQTKTLTTEWQRIEYTGSIDAGGIRACWLFGVGGASNVEVHLWGGQLNVGSTAKPYFPTTDRLNVPRLTYQNGGGGCPSLLLEKQSTNINTYSEDFSNVAYAKENATITTNQTTSPDGTTNADKLTDDGVNNFHIVYPNTLSITASRVTTSIYLKNNDIQFGAIQLATSIGGTYDTRFTIVVDLINGTITDTEQVGTPNATYSIENVGNQWYRLNLTCDHISGSVASVVAGSNSGTPSSFVFALPIYVGTGKSLFLWGMQVEASSYPTSYIPTTSSSATRVIDDCRKTGISSLIGQTEGTMFIDLNLTAWDSNSFYFGLYGGGNEIYFRCAGTGAIDFVHYFGATQAFITKSGLSLGRHKLAACYKNNDWAFYVDGILVGTDTSGTFSGTISQMVFGYTSISAYPPFQSVNQTILFPTRLTNAELASLTTI
jgi:hypothetical protein